MKKVTYTYNVRVLGCGCCSESANYLEITDVATGWEVYWTDRAPTFCSQSELEEYVVEIHNLQEHEFVVDIESEFL